MIAGHAKYVQGAAASALGYESGEATKSAAVEEMRSARDQSGNSQQQPAQGGVLGTVEQKLGEVTGCEGMKEEGKERQGSQ